MHQPADPLRHLPDRLCLPLSFDPVRLVADLDALQGGDWVRHVARMNYQGDWTMLPLRYAAGETHRLRQVYADVAATGFEDGPLLARSPYFRELLAGLRCPLRVVRLMRLAPGSAILEHEDLDLDAALGRVRLHVPITTSDAVEFRVNGTPVAMAPGSLWYLRLSDPHSAVNRGSDDRVHLVIDAEVDPWLRSLLLQAAARQPSSASA